MSTISLRLPDSLHKKVRELAKSEDVSINQLIATALAEKMSALMTVDYLRERGALGDRSKYEAVLAKVRDTEPDKGDELPCPTKASLHVGPTPLSGSELVRTYQVWDNARMSTPESTKGIVWVASSLKDLREFPDEARQVMGYALYLAQSGDKHVSAKPLRGFGGAGVLEVVDDYDGDTYRTVYTVRFAHAVYVLHAFQKKSKRGIATPKHDIDLIRDRLEMARRLHEERHGTRKGELR